MTAWLQLLEDKHQSHNYSKAISILIMHDNKWAYRLRHTVDEDNLNGKIAA